MHKHNYCKKGDFAHMKQLDWGLLKEGILDRLSNADNYNTQE